MLLYGVIDFNDVSVDPESISRNLYLTGKSFGRLA